MNAYLGFSYKSSITDLHEYQSHSDIENTLLKFKKRIIQKYKTLYDAYIASWKLIK